MLTNLYSFLSTLVQYYHVYYFSSSSGPILPKGWTTCSNASDILTIQKLSYKPDPPIRSKPLSVTFIGKLNKPVTGGTVSFTVRLGGFAIYRDSWELCSTLKMEPQVPQCPIKAGIWKVQVNTEIPSHVIPAVYGIEAELWDQDKNRINCIKADIQIRGSNESPEENETAILPKEQNKEELENNANKEELENNAKNVGKILQGNIIYMEEDGHYNNHDLQ